MRFLHKKINSTDEVILKFIKIQTNRGKSGIPDVHRKINSTDQVNIKVF